MHKLIILMIMLRRSLQTTIDQLVKKRIFDLSQHHLGISFLHHHILFDISGGNTHLKTRTSTSIGRGINQLAEKSGDEMD